MINPASWNSFTVSRSSSYAQHNFYIQVEDRNEGLFVTGEVRGEDGTIYNEEDGILLSRRVAEEIYRLEPALLPDCQPKPTETEGEDELIVLDQFSVEVEVVCTDGRVLEKVDEDDFSLKVYKIVLRSFEKKCGR